MTFVWLVEERDPDGGHSVTVYDFVEQKAEAEAHARSCAGRLLVAQVVGP